LVIPVAGEPGNIDLVLENMRHLARTNKKAFSRESIRITVNKAFKQFVSEWVMDGMLPAYNMDIEEFKKTGRKFLGDDLFREVAKRMNDEVKKYLTDELLVIGWGKSELSAMIHQKSAITSSSHALSGMAAIGSGGEVALSTLLLLGQSRYTPLEEALYNVAAAKFMAEKSEGDDVGRATGMFIARQRVAGDDPQLLAGTRIQDNEIKEIRELWEKHGKPKTPVEAMFPIENILRRSGMQGFRLSTGTKIRIMQLRY
jgi:hypothetical protein